MSLTIDEKTLVRESFLRIAADIDESSRLFYDRLFEIAPETKALFAHTDMQEQGRVLMRMLDRVVESLNIRTAVEPEMQQLGQRHMAYGVQPEHYQPFGKALIWMIRQRLGGEFTAEAAVAWHKAFNVLVEYATGTPASEA